MTVSNKFQKNGIYALYLTCFTCLFSTALTSIFSTIMLICWLASGTFKNMPLIIKENSISLLGIVFCTLLLVGIVYSPASLEVSLDFFKRYRVLLFVPIVLSLTKGQPNIARNVVNALLLGYLLVLANAYLLDFGLISNKFAVKRGGGGFLVIFAYLVLQRAILEKKLRFLWGGFFLAICYDIFFILNTRTGWLIFIILAVLFIFQHFSIKKQLIFYVLLVFLLSGIFYASSSVQYRVNQTINSLQKYDAVKRNAFNDGLGLRLDWYQNSIELIKGKPVFGYGTGAYEIAQKPLVEGTSTVPATDPHNEFFLTTVQIGFVGLSVLLALFLDPVLRSFKLIRCKENAQAFALQATVLFLFIGCFSNSWLLSTVPGHIFAFLIVAFYPIRELSRG